MSIAIASIIGFVNSFIPNIFDIFQDKRDKQQELAIMQLMLEREKLGLAAKEQEISTQADAQVMQTLYQTANAPTGIKWVDAVNGMMRPVMAFIITFDYILVTYLQYIVLTGAGLMLTTGDIVNVLWSKETQELFAVIVTFYFGRRVNGKA